jgi:hypothetical protein
MTGQPARRAGGSEVSDDDTKPDDQAESKPVEDAKSDDGPVAETKSKDEAQPEPVDATNPALNDKSTQTSADKADANPDDALRAAFPDARPTELALWAALRDSAPITSRVISVEADLPNPSVRASFFRWFLLEAIPAKKLPIIRVELRGASIEGQLDLAGSKLDYLLRFKACQFLDTIDLDDARIFGFDLFGGSATKFCGDRMVATGSLRLCGAREYGNTPGPEIARIQLHGAKISGNLDLRRAKLTNAAPEHDDDIPFFADGIDDIPFFADGITVSGNMLLSDGFTASGEIRLNGSKIQRNLYCTSAKLTNQDGYSLSAAGAEFAGSVYLNYERSDAPASDRPFVSIGTVRFDGAKIQGDLDCIHGQSLSRKAAGND